MSTAGIFFGKKLMNDFEFALIHSKIEDRIETSGENEDSLSEIEPKENDQKNESTEDIKYQISIFLTAPNLGNLKSKLEQIEKYYTEMQKLPKDDQERLNFLNDFRSSLSENQDRNLVFSRINELPDALKDELFPILFDIFTEKKCSVDNPANVDHIIQYFINNWYKFNSELFQGYFIKSFNDNFDSIVNNFLDQFDDNLQNAKMNSRFLQSAAAITDAVQFSAKQNYGFTFIFKIFKRYYIQYYYNSTDCNIYVDKIYDNNCITDSQNGSILNNIDIICQKMYNFQQSANNIIKQACSISNFPVNEALQELYSIIYQCYKSSFMQLKKKLEQAPKTYFQKKDLSMNLKIAVVNSCFLLLNHFDDMVNQYDGIREKLNFMSLMPSMASSIAKSLFTFNFFEAILKNANTINTSYNFFSELYWPNLDNYKLLLINAFYEEQNDALINLFLKYYSKRNGLQKCIDTCNTIYSHSLNFYHELCKKLNVDFSFEHHEQILSKIQEIFQTNNTFGDISKIKIELEKLNEEIHKIDQFGA